MADDKNEDTKDDNAKENKDQRQTIAAEERSEYFKKLEKWLHEAYAWQSMAAMFPYYLMSGQIINPSGFEYRIPPIWKRFVAEFIDSTMLFLLKFSITFIAIDVFDFIDIDDLDLVRANLRIDYKMALEMTYGILVLEIIHRVIVCIFEAFWLQHGINGRIGGATPGKSMMGLRVVQCRNVTPVDRPDDPDVVLVSPGTDLGLPLALGRSVVKNMILAFLFPICFALFFFRFNRTVYDLLCNSIVVEDPYRNLNNNRLHQQ
ncbi:protein FAM8A1 isoform X2 [Frieseomelitta varia]|uniref:protein FAM8A1 isoform X2 n=1 Tax=Frieseomelitta varia TaxID=561572 RepID=UPI001CB69E92|nr:protein FAM8A1 isoform X2 [Frieseomelitta varia]